MLIARKSVVIRLMSGTVFTLYSIFTYFYLFVCLLNGSSLTDLSRGHDLTVATVIRTFLMTPVATAVQLRYKNFLVRYQFSIHT
jgi:hypothetical protein